MPSHNTELEVERVVARALGECKPGQAVWLGPGIPERLVGRVPVREEPATAQLALVEVGEVSPNGVAVVASVPQPPCPVVGLSATPVEKLDALLRPHDHVGVALTKLICPFAVFEFDKAGPVVREVRRGLTAADLQTRLAFALWAGPDLKELDAS
ncbi:MAG: hypothetical protein AAF500_11430 [Myxococcota bacterium]